MKLTKDCNQRLGEIEKKVKQLLKAASSKEDGASSRSSKSKDE